MRSLRILFVTPYVPSLLRARAYNLIKHLSAEGHRITVLAIGTSKQDQEDAAALRRHCERVETIHVSLGRSLWNCLRAAYTNLPLQALYCDSPAMHALLRHELNGGSSRAHQAVRDRGRAHESYDVVHVEHLRAVLFGLNISGVPRVYDAVDCISHLFEKTARMGATAASRWKAFVDLDRTRRFEGGLVGRFERILTTSQQDKRALQALSCGFREPGRTDGRDPIQVLPQGVDADYFRPTTIPRDAATLVYVGRMAYHANITAVRYFVEHVLPRIWAQRADARFVVVGKDPPREIQALTRRYGERVRVTGYVPDIRPYLATATVSVSPLVYAAGIQNKVLEAMAMTTPVVTSVDGATALRARDGEQLLLARDAPDFAMQVVRLLADSDLQRRIGAGGRHYVETHHDWRQIVRELQVIYHDVSRRADHGLTGAGKRGWRHAGSG
jgi:glycosyltransferase involved in cell wall biosynthesis